MTGRPLLALAGEPPPPACSTPILPVRPTCGGGLGAHVRRRALALTGWLVYRADYASSP
jgi:hypothetical protein